MEDNFYKVSTERLIQPPKEQQEKTKRDKILYERERPLITAVVKRLEEKISVYEKIDSVKNTTDPEAFMREIAVNKQTCAILRSELSWIKTKVKMFDDKKLR